MCAALLAQPYLPASRILDEDCRGTSREKHDGDGHFRQVFFGRLVCLLTIVSVEFNQSQLEEGSARLLIAKFDVKKRNYYGNTSMESEISLLMANQTLVCLT